MIKGFNERKNKDIVFVMDFTKTTKFNKTKLRAFEVFKKIYEK